MKKLLLLPLLASVLFTSQASAVENYTMDFKKDTRGLVRKLQIYKDPTWAAKVETKDSKVFYFTSPKSLMEFYYNPKKWPETKVSTSDDLKDIIVTDYATLNPIDAKYAFYVYGSNKISFAGDDLPAFKDINDAKNFLHKNNGKRILKFEELTNGLIKLLNGDI